MAPPTPCREPFVAEAALRLQRLPRAAPYPVLACGAYLKNQAALLLGDELWWSPLHGDLGTADAQQALAASLQALAALARARGATPAAVAHDRHPDFPSTRLAVQWAARLGVPALAVQHHHAHLAVVQAEQGWGLAGDEAPLLGLALDGVGLGDDGLAWGGELLRVSGGRMRRLAHLPLLALPGGDAAAREPWRMAAAVLQWLGRPQDIVTELPARCGVRPEAARVVAQMLARDLHCPRSSGAGRWFDAAAALLGLAPLRQAEAEAAIALERAATDWLASQPEPAWTSAAVSAGVEAALDLRPLFAQLLTLEGPQRAGQGAALFHLALAQGLVAAAAQAHLAPETPARRELVLAGGCFFNTLLRERLVAGLAAHGLRACLPGPAGCGDAGLAAGQAWAAALQLAEAGPAAASAPPEESFTCA